MQWLKKERPIVDERLQHSDSTQSQYGRLGGLIQVCRPSLSARRACYAARILLERGVTEFREVGNLADYLAYLEIQLARYANSLGSEPGQQGCEREVVGWAEYWQRFRDIA